MAGRRAGVRPAERIALIERIARARTWTQLTESERMVQLRIAEALLIELEATKEQADRLGWIFVELDEESEVDA